MRATFAGLRRAQIREDLSDVCMMLLDTYLPPRGIRQSASRVIMFGECQADAMGNDCMWIDPRATGKLHEFTKYVGGASAHLLSATIGYVRHVIRQCGNQMRCSFGLNPAMGQGLLF